MGLFIKRRVLQTSSNEFVCKWWRHFIEHHMLVFFFYSFYFSVTCTLLSCAVFPKLHNIFSYVKDLFATRWKIISWNKTEAKKKHNPLQVLFYFYFYYFFVEWKCCKWIYGDLINLQREFGFNWRWWLWTIQIDFDFLFQTFNTLTRCIGK